ncbi:helix-turn-helix domain-containing protein [Alsobacter sp. SYSU BS001988]
MTVQHVSSFGDGLRRWRQHRRLSQLDLALDAEVSQRHLSFVESGRASPSREMVLRLTERLDLPLRDRNALLLAAGYAPIFPERPLDDPAMGRARDAIRRLLKGHEPYPALAVDRLWRMVASNAAVAPLLAGVADAALLAPPVNVLRLSLHPDGLASRIVNLPQWREHVLDRLRRQADAAADAALLELLRELETYAPPARPARRRPAREEGPHWIVPLEIETPAGVLSFISTTTVFGAPMDVTLAEIAIEAFFPADERTAQALRTG